MTRESPAPYRITDLSTSDRPRERLAELGGPHGLHRATTQELSQLRGGTGQGSKIKARPAARDAESL